MASNPEFVQYIADQLADAGHITYRKMFGEYALYCDGKICALVCDNQLLVKKTEIGRQIAPYLELVPIPGYSEKKFFSLRISTIKNFLRILFLHPAGSFPCKRQENIKITNNKERT